MQKKVGEIKNFFRQALHSNHEDQAFSNGSENNDSTLIVSYLLFVFIKFTPNGPF